MVCIFFHIFVWIYMGSSWDTQTMTFWSRKKKEQRLKISITNRDFHDKALLSWVHSSCIHGLRHVVVREQYRNYKFIAPTQPLLKPSTSNFQLVPKNLHLGRFTLCLSIQPSLEGGGGYWNNKDIISERGVFWQRSLKLLFSSWIGYFW